MMAPILLAAGGLALFFLLKDRQGSFPLPPGFTGSAASTAVVRASTGREYMVMSYPPRAGDSATFHLAALSNAPETHQVSYLQLPDQSRTLHLVKAPTQAEEQALRQDFGV